MLLKTIIATALVAISLYSAGTNAAELKGETCTLGVLPLGTSMNEDTKKQEILEAYEAKGFIVTFLKGESELADVEFVSDATVECISNYFGIASRTTVRLTSTRTNTVVAKVTTPLVGDLFNCKIELFKAIAALPACTSK